MRDLNRALHQITMLCPYIDYTTASGLSGCASEVTFKLL